MINLVIVGVGDIAVKRHIPAVLRAQSGRLYGFSSRRAETADTFAEKYGVKSYHAYEDVLADENVQAVLISAPPAAHAQLAVSALQAGKYVLLEKPMTRSVQEAEQIVAAEKAAAAETEAAGKKRPPRVTMLHVQRRYKPHIKAKELLEEGAIGDLLTVRTVLANADFRLLEGIAFPAWQDALYDVGIHRIDLIRWLVGSEVTGVTGLYSSRICGKDSNDHSQAILQFDSGVVGMLISSRISFHGEDRSTVLIGTKGTITTYAGGHDLILQRPNRETEVFDFGETTKQGVLELTDLHERFFRSIEDGTEPEITSQDGLASVKIADAIRRSSDEGRWISLQ